VKTDAVAGDKIEFFSQIGQGRLRSDARNDPVDAEDLGCAVKERIVVSVQAESFVAEQLANVEEITGPTAKIQNVKRRSAIEPKILNVLYIDANPVSCVFVSINPSCVGSVPIMLPKPFQFGSVNCGENPTGAHRVTPAPSVFPDALSSVKGKQFLESSRKSHA